jgi:hypothetical protein
MKKTTQPKPATTPAAAPVKPTPGATPTAAPVKPLPVYYQSDASKIAYLLERSEPEQCEFFHALMDEWEKGMYSLTEAAFMHGADAVGINWISDIEDLTREDALFRGLRLVMIVDDWFADFLRRILKSYDHTNPLTPDDVAEDLQSCLLDFQHEIRDARNLIENHPETVAGHIRRAIQKRPELVA